MRSRSVTAPAYSLVQAVTSAGTTASWISCGSTMSSSTPRRPFATTRTSPDTTSTSVVTGAVTRWRRMVLPWSATHDRRPNARTSSRPLSAVVESWAARRRACRERAGPSWRSASAQRCQKGNHRSISSRMSGWASRTIGGGGRSPVVSVTSAAIAVRTSGGDVGSSNGSVTHAATDSGGAGGCWNGTGRTPSTTSVSTPGSAEATAM